MAAFSVSGPRIRMTVDAVRDYGERAVETSREISGLLRDI